MAKDKFIPIPLIPDPDDTATPTAPPMDGATTVDPTAVLTPPMQRDPQQQAAAADLAARDVEGANRRALVIAAEAIRKKYPGNGDRTPDPQEQSILDLYDREYGQGNLDRATAQADAEQMPTILKPVVAAGEGVADAVDKAGYAMGVGSGEYKPTVPGGATGAVTKNVTQFVTGMAATLATMNGQGIQAGAGKLADAGRLAFATGTTQALFVDPHEENLSNLIEQHSSLAKPITDYLAANPNDTEAVARTKKFFEGAGLGLATDGLLAALKLVKLGRAARAGDKAAPSAYEAANAELQGLIHQAMSPEGSYLRLTPEAEAAAPAAEKVASPAVTATTEATKPAATTTPSKQLISPEMADKLRASVENHKDLLQGGIDFNFKHLPDNPDALAMINEVSKVLEPVMGEATGGVRSLQTTSDLADMIGAKPAEVIANVSKLAGLAKNADVTITSGKALFTSLADQIDKQSTLINTMKLNGESTEAAQADLLKLVNIHAKLQMDLKGAITGTARATGAGRIDIKALGVQNMEEAAQLFSMADGNPTAIARLIRPLTTGEKVFGAIHEWRVNCMLSGVRTLVVKGTSDLLQGIALPTAKMVGGIAHGDLAAVREGASTAVGLFKSLSESFSMARKALNSGAPILDAPSELSGGFRHYIGSDSPGMLGSLVNALGTVVRFPTRLIGTLDEFSKQLSYRAAVYAQSTREGVSKGLTGDALASYIEDSSARAFDPAGRATNETALQYAQEATFTNDLEYGIGKWISDGANKLPVVRSIVPFVKVPTNLARNAMQYTPGLQWLERSFREDMAAGGVRAAQARGKQIIGAGLYALATYLATSGKITGAGPQDSEARKAKLDTGWQPYSLKIGDRYVSYSRLDPYGMPFGLVADAAETFGRVDGETADKVAGAMVHSLAHNITSKTYLGGLITMMDAIANPDQAHAMKVYQSFLGSFVPNTRQFADLIPETADPYMRETRDLLDGVRSRVPGLSKTLAPARNLFGEPIHVPEGLGLATLSPFYTSKGIPDDLSAELAKFPKGFSLPATKVGNVDLTQIPSKEGGYDSFDRLLQLNGSVRVNGRTLRDHLASYIHSPEYAKLTDDGPSYSGSKFEAVSGIIAQHRQAALSALMKENAGVKAAVRADRENTKAALTKGPDAVSPMDALMKTLQRQPR